MTRTGRIRPIILTLAIVFIPWAHARVRVNGSYTATAYSTRGETASGELTHRHIAAADPNLLPLGSLIRISRAGRYSGEYEIADTGGKIVGRKIDLFIPNLAEAKRFGKRVVRVNVIKLASPAK
jgi:3D (Asp-Asp-Asp) domain-containing protein